MFIDKKGRLFGKINIIDFLVIVFILNVIPMFYYGYKLFKPAYPPLVNFLPLTITIEQSEYDKLKKRCKKLDKWLIENKKMEKYFNE